MLVLDARSTRRFAGALLAVLSACSSGVDPAISPDSIWLRTTPEVPTLPDGVRVRAVTLNLHGGQDAPVERVIEVLRPLQLDVLGLQECPAPYATAIALGLGSLSRAGEEGNVLLSRTALSSTRAVSMLSGRGFVHARTTIDGEDFSLYAAHIGWNAEGSRQAREFVDAHLSQDPVRRVLVVGDFNDEHLSNQASILEELLEDAYTASGTYPGQHISWPATGFDGSEGSQLIDLHYYRRADPAIVVRTEIINATPAISDHKPSLAELMYPRGARVFGPGDDPFTGRREPWAIVTRNPSSNRLLDPGAEQGGVGWVADNGGEIARGEREHQPPHGGEHHFTGASDGFSRPDPISGWSQRVALDDARATIDAGRAWLEVAGWMAIGFRVDIDGDVRANSPRPYDEGELVVDLEDARGATLTRWSSGRRDPLKYHPVGARVAVPPGTRIATMRLWSHLKEASGPSHDAVFDDLYLALVEGETHPAGARAIAMDGETDAAWGDWQRLRDGASIGVMIYPPRTRSGRGHFVAGAEPGMATAEAGATVDAGALRFGGWLRSMNGRGTVTLALDLYEEDAATPWGRFALDPVGAAEWTLAEGQLAVPEGITRAVLRATGDAREDLVLADELVVTP